MEHLFKIKYLGGDSFHEDIQLDISFAQETIIIDSYYLFNEEKGGENILDCLRSLLVKWQEAVQTVHSGQAIYLILDFSDQYFGGFCVEYGDESKVNLSYGIIREAFDLNMEPVIYNIRNHKFVKTKEVTTTLFSLLSSIEENLNGLN